MSDPSTLDTADLDKRYVWHPFTQMSEWLDSDPLVIERGRGNYLYDATGRALLDGNSSLWVNIHGHGRAEIVEAIASQARRLAHATMLGATNRPAAELAARLVELAPRGLEKVFYSDNGSTAVEIALKLAFQYWVHRGEPQRTHFVHLADGYHGDTLGAVGVGGIEVFHQVFGPLIRPGIRVANPRWFRNPAASNPDEAREHALAELAAVLTSRGQEIAAVILEPLVQGAGGMLVQPPGYLKQAAALCRQHRVLLIADEVATGFGRTGSMFACDREQVAPDFLCLAKGITGGTLPLAATLTTREVFDAFLGAPTEGKAFFHGHTYTGNPVACAAALASLDLFERDQVFHHLPGKIARLSEQLQSQLSPHPHVGDIRQCGMMVGVELVASRDTLAPFPAERRIGVQVCRTARNHGVILRPLGDVVVLVPPLSVTDSDVDLLVASVARSLAEVLHS